MKLYTLGPKEFKRRFKLNRPQFDDLVEKIKPMVEVDDRGKDLAERYSGSFVPVALQSAATLRWLACKCALCVPRGQLQLGNDDNFWSVWKVV